MAVFILVSVVFIPGFVILIAGKVPLTRRRSVNDAAARLVGVLLMVPLPLYLIACKSCHVPPLATEEQIQLIMDPLMPFTAGYLHIGTVAATVFCILLAAVLAMATSEVKRR
jgi:hypothetical protein